VQDAPDDDHIEGQRRLKTLAFLQLQRFDPATAFQRRKKEKGHQKEKEEKGKEEKRRTEEKGHQQKKKETEEKGHPLYLLATDQWFAGCLGLAHASGAEQLGNCAPYVGRNRNQRNQSGCPFLFFFLFYFFLFHQSGCPFLFLFLFLSFLFLWCPFLFLWINRAEARRRRERQKISNKTSSGILCASAPLRETFSRAG
jgi:hypothetical protein